MPQVLSTQVKPIHATLLLQLPDGLPARANESSDDAVGVGADGAIHGAPGALRGERALGLGPRAEGRLDGTLRRVVVAEADVAPVGTGHGQAIDLLGLAERVYTSVHQVLVRKRIHVDLAVCRCRIHLGTPRHRHLVDVQHQRDRLLALALALALALTRAHAHARALVCSRACLVGPSCRASSWASGAARCSPRPRPLGRTGRNFCSCGWRLRPRPPPPLTSGARLRGGMTEISPGTCTWEPCPRRS
mmetsp:Transcript_31207/g.99550  ORF Transcript_31207/g.99550 Transcript_31207/m.99550 type:complete len:247 (+) Transcript_31207:946-1686(+)